MNVTLLPNNLVIAVVLLSASGIVGYAQPDRAAEIPYAGKWKLNVAKSDFGERSLAFAETGSGAMQMTYLGQAYTFKVDGKDYPAILGLTAAWKQIDPDTWEAVYKRQAKLQFTDTLRLSADGKTLTINSKGVCLGPTIPAGATLTIQKTGPRAFDMTRKLNGKPLFRSSFTVSDDGKTLTVTGGPLAAGEKTTVVYDRIEQ